MAELEPCPFCGGENLTIVEDEKKFFVGCYDCITCGPEQETEEAAVEAWNRRVNNGG